MNPMDVEISIERHAASCPWESAVTELTKKVARLEGRLIEVEHALYERGESR